MGESERAGESGRAVERGGPEEGESGRVREGSVRGN